MRIASGVLCLLLLASGCGKQEKKRIAVIPMGRAHLYWQSIHAGAVAAARELNVDIVWNGPATETDYSGQLQIADAMINNRVDAIAIAPIDRTAMVSVVERAAREKIPVVIFDSGINTENILAQVSTDNYRGGVLGAERIGKILGGKGKVAMVAVQPGSASTMLRERASKKPQPRNFRVSKLSTSAMAWRISPNRWPQPRTC
jgi:ribose transport system substrate-binding protein